MKGEIQMEIKVEKQIIEMLQRLTEKVDKLEGRFANLEGRFDGLEERIDNLEGRQIETQKELRDFRSETSQNFATLIDSDKKVRSEFGSVSSPFSNKLVV
jgi:predicted nuclease with TOPRIM domain